VIRCLAIDDEPLALEVIKGHVEKIPFLELNGTYRSGIEAMDEINRGGIDLIFLDIQMNDITGIELLQTLSNPPMVIFTTAYEEYALEGYNLSVVDYLLKPIAFDRFLKASNKALQLSSPKQQLVSKEGATEAEEFVFVKSDKGSSRINLSELLYVEGLKEYVQYVTRSDKIVSLQSLKKILDYLPDNRFVQVHRSFIIAIDKIDSISGNRLFISGTEIPIGETYKRHFNKLIDEKKL
jgi:two-component system, LytTR family, response regulator